MVEDAPGDRGRRLRGIDPAIERRVDAVGDEHEHVARLEAQLGRLQLGEAAAHDAGAGHEVHARRRARGARAQEHALHDEAGQLLVSVYIALENVARRLPRESRPELVEVRDRVDQVEERLRHLSHELRPTILDHLGLIPALRFLAEGVSSRSELKVRVEGRLPKRLETRTETLLYRVVQEALADVVRSGKARCVTVSVEHREDLVQCTVEDDGAALEGSTQSDPRAPGLVVIHERVRALGGAVRVEPAKYKGTALTVSVPFKEAQRCQSES